MYRIAIATTILLLAHAAMAENLVANPGFESLNVDLPQRWDVFVQPQPGAAGSLVPSAHAGDYAVMLHTPRPYDREPLNNWSQNILRDGLGGKTLRAEAAIRVAEATEAALWIQCWRRRPWSLLHTANSSFDSPVYGTQEWQTVSMTFDVPEGTDYLTVRCVLIGTGSAWFDAVSLEEVVEEDAVSQVDEAERDSPDKNVTPPPLAVVTPLSVDAPTEPQNTLVVAVPRIEPPATAPLEPEPAAAPVETPVIPAAPSSPPPALPGTISSELATASADNRALAESIAQLEAENRALLNELVSIRESILSLEGSPAPAPRTPPLVPHGADWKEVLR